MQMEADMHAATPRCPRVQRYELGVLAENLSLAPPAAARRLERQLSSRLSTWRAEDALSWASSFLPLADVAVLRDCDVDGPGLLQIHSGSLCDCLGLSLESARVLSTRLAELVEEDSSYDTSACPSPEVLLQSSSTLTLAAALPQPAAAAAATLALAPEVLLAEPLTTSPDSWLVVETKYGRTHTSAALFDRTVLQLACEVRVGGPNGHQTTASHQFDLAVVNCLGSRLRFPVCSSNLPEYVHAPFSLQNQAPGSRFGASTTYSFRVGPTALYAEFRLAVDGQVFSFGTTVRNARARSEDWRMEVLPMNESGVSEMRLVHQANAWQFLFSSAAPASGYATPVPSAFEVHRPVAGRYLFQLPPQGWRGVVAAVPTADGRVHLYFLPEVQSFLGGVSLVFGRTAMPTAVCAFMHTLHRASKRERDE